MAQMSGLAILTTTWRAWVVDAELVRIEQERVVVRYVQLLLVAQQLLPPLRDRRNQSLANLACQSLVFFFGLVHFLLGQAVDFGN